MSKKIKNVGIDLVEISRFKRFKGHIGNFFLKKVFSKAEIIYCFKFKDSATHLAGIFAAKEAVSKVLGTNRYPFIKIEIRHRHDGSPQVWIRDRRSLVNVSITHTKKIAAAIAIG